VSGVERAHRRNQRDFSSELGSRACQFFTVTNDLHASAASVNLRWGRRFDAAG
jgi:hypothetical protein